MGNVRISVLERKLQRARHWSSNSGMNHCWCKHISRNGSLPWARKSTRIGSCRQLTLQGQCFQSLASRQMKRRSILTPVVLESARLHHKLILTFLILCVFQRCSQQSRIRVRMVAQLSLMYHWQIGMHLWEELWFKTREAH